MDRRAFLLGTAALGFSAASAEALTTPQKLMLMDAVPPWMRGMDMAWDFTKPIKRPNFLLNPADTHAATIYAPNTTGVYAPYAANVLTRTDLGLQTVPTRTNLSLYSATYSNAYWTKTNVAVSSDAVAGLTETVDADLLTENAVTADHILRSTAIAVTGQAYAVSVWAKTGVGSRGVGISVETGAFTSGAYVGFAMNGTITQAANFYGASFSAVSGQASTETYNGYRRFTLFFTASGAFNITVMTGLHNGTSTSYAGDNASGNYFANVLVEAAGFAGAPIYTTAATATVTGNQQVIDLTGRLGTGVAGVVQVNALQAGAANCRVLSIDDGTANNRIQLTWDVSNGVLVVTTGGVSQATGVTTYASQPTAGVATMAFAVGTNYAMARAVGQAAPTADTSVSYPVVDRAAIGGLSYIVTGNMYQFTRKFALKFGPQDATTFAALYDRAVQMAASS